MSPSLMSRSSSPAVPIVASAAVATLTKDAATASRRFPCCCCYRDAQQVEMTTETDRLLSTQFIDQQNSGYHVPLLLARNSHKSRSTEKKKSPLLILDWIRVSEQKPSM